MFKQLAKTFLILIIPAFILGCDKSPVERTPLKSVTKIADIGPNSPDVYRIDDDERGYTLYVATKGGAGVGITAVQRTGVEKR